jgi:hypothetical protein
MNEDDRIQRAQRAAHEWREIGGAFDAVEAALLRELIQTPVGQEPKVLNLHKAIQNLAAVRQAVLMVVQDGQVADVELRARSAISQAGFTRPN